MPAIPQKIAADWLERWDRQQEGYLPDREERFTAIIDAVEASIESSDPLIVDLGCGPGSLSVRLLDRIPKATVIAIDADPLLLALGRAAYSNVEGLVFADLDLATPGWAQTLEVDGPVDAAVSTTALHWLSETELRTTYSELATLLRSNGLLLNGDHLTMDHTPGILRLEETIVEAIKQRHFDGDRPEDWGQWWDAVSADPVLSPFVTKRATSQHHGSNAGQLQTHVDALQEAGFGEIGTLWQHGNNRVLCAVKP